MDEKTEVAEDDCFVNVRSSATGVIKVILEVWSEEGEPDERGHGTAAVSFLNADQARRLAAELVRLAGRKE